VAWEDEETGAGGARVRALAHHGEGGSILKQQPGEEEDGDGEGCDEPGEGLEEAPEKGLEDGEAVATAAAAADGGTKGFTPFAGPALLEPQRKPAAGVPTAAQPLRSRRQSDASVGAAAAAPLRCSRGDSGRGPPAVPAPAAAEQAASLPPQQPQSPPPLPKALFLYGSQTGTGQEVARGLRDEAARRGVPAEVLSLNELGWSSMGAGRAPVAVIVASSTGDGDPPDNAARFFKAMLAVPPPGGASSAAAGGGSIQGSREQQPAPCPLAGVAFALLGLGDSSYSRFMRVPRAIRARLAELGAGEFYAAGEADAADGNAAATVRGARWEEGTKGPAHAHCQGSAMPGQGPPVTPSCHVFWLPPHLPSARSSRGATACGARCSARWRPLPSPPPQQPPAQPPSPRQRQRSRHPRRHRRRPPARAAAPGSWRT
jgi:flavodoxin